MIKRIIAVTSCKGGVGKSTIAVNLAYTLSTRGLKVGLFDADIHGPSLPSLISPDDTTIKLCPEGQYVEPIEYAGVVTQSFGFMQQLWRRSFDEAVVMRGPIPSRLITALLNSTVWGDLDVLVLDIPPGTGDIPLNILEHTPIDGAVVISTPHQLSLADTLKGVEMLHGCGVPVWGVIENMATFTCGSCDALHRPFGQGALDKVMGAVKNAGSDPAAFSLPIDVAISHGDPMPVVLGDAGPGIYNEIAAHCEEMIATEPGGGHKLPFANVHANPQSHHWPSLMEMAQLQLK